jgi:hypothetical protein
MKLISRLREQRYCAFCGSRRRVYVKKHIDLTNVGAMILLAAGITHVVFGSADPRGLAVFGLLCATGEAFIYLRWRSSIVCRLCGFDPVIYKRSPRQASDQVAHFFREQAERPEFWLSRSPLLDRYRGLREQERLRQRHAAVRASASSSSGAMIDPRAHENSSGHSHLQ